MLIYPWHVSMYFLDLGVLISGGFNGEGLKSAEIYFPSSNTRCSLPELPVERSWHTQDGQLACGGVGGSKTMTSCDKWSPDSGSWTQSHTLRQRKYYHVSWNTEDGVHLIGGSSSIKTTELVKEDDSVGDGFSLKYDNIR